MPINWHIQENKRILFHCHPRLLECWIIISKVNISTKHVNNMLNLEINFILWFKMSIYLSIEYWCLSLKICSLCFYINRLHSQEMTVHSMPDCKTWQKLHRKVTTIQSIGLKLLFPHLNPTSTISYQQQSQKNGGRDSQNPKPLNPNSFMRVYFIWYSELPSRCCIYHFYQNFEADFNNDNN